MTFIKKQPIDEKWHVIEVLWACFFVQLFVCVCGKMEITVRGLEQIALLKEKFLFPFVVFISWSFSLTVFSCFWSLFTLPEQPWAIYLIFFDFLPPPPLLLLFVFFCVLPLISLFALFVTDIVRRLEPQPSHGSIYVFLFIHLTFFATYRSPHCTQPRVNFPSQFSRTAPEINRIFSSN